VIERQRENRALVGVRGMISEVNKRERKREIERKRGRNTFAMRK